MKQNFPQNPLDREILAMLIISKLDELEKRLWIATLPNMTEVEKNKLKTNLGKEIQYEVKAREQAMIKFTEALEKGI